MGETVDLMQMLEARERRVFRQEELLERYRLPLVSFTMNIAGPMKNSPLIRRGFQAGERLLLGQFQRAGIRCVHAERIDEATGCEGLYAVDCGARQLKTLTEELEEGTDLGRLFDMDVLSPGGEKLDRAVPRRCLICGGDGKACASRRVHTVAELQEKTREILQTALDRLDAEIVGTLACRALLYEVCVTPKPGLVDRANSGSHRDMNFYTFLRSAAALVPYFTRCASIGRESAAGPPRETFALLRFPGKLAEAAMLDATGGVNTHKGAIFSMGLVCAALGRLDRAAWASPSRVLSEAAAMAEGLTEQDFADLTAETARTTGQKLWLEYGISGVRGQAEAGFPAVLDYGLPVLERGLEAGKSQDEAGAAAMLALLCHTADTNLIARGNVSVQRETASQIAELLENQPYPDRETLEQLDRAFIEKNLSPGGSADLLALCWLLHFVREETD
ncbi:MAG: triphosphoribosyl-dephospho-CoA synthase CitG, partial [Oscillibacter sp.]|nr:triphosphoribosyl-dephospho-CoA synthase CitG [Oscillibacter sp.]